MTVASAQPNQTLIAVWLGQLAGTVIIAAVVLAFFGSAGSPFKGADPVWAHYALAGVLVATAPALAYLRTFKARLDADTEAQRLNGGVPHPGYRPVLMKSLSIGGALCELPQALGLAHLLLGGETRYFLAATLVTIALRISYRPFTRLARSQT